MSPYIITYVTKDLIQIFKVRTWQAEQTLNLCMSCLHKTHSHGPHALLEVNWRYSSFIFRHVYDNSISVFFSSAPLLNGHGLTHKQICNVLGNGNVVQSIIISAALWLYTHSHDECKGNCWKVRLWQISKNVQSVSACNYKRACRHALLLGTQLYFKEL